MSILVTGAAGFIGNYVATLLLERGEQVVGVDNLNDYYDPTLKKDRLERLKNHRGFRFLQSDVETLTIGELDEAPERIVHLAAQAGVRYSLENPQVYVSSNLVGFAQILELARASDCGHLVYASSSSVYGANTRVPFAVADQVNHPVSLYAATKRSNELMAQAYSHLYGIPCTGLRFFTVYGPWGRPDMAIFDFTRRIMVGEPVHLYGQGLLSRDFTYIDDIADGVVLALDKPPSAGETLGQGINESAAPHRVFNIGKGSPVQVADMVDALEQSLGRKANRVLVGRQPGDVDHTWADVEEFKLWCGFEPQTSLGVGVSAFADWYRGRYGYGGGC